MNSYLKTVLIALCITIASCTTQAMEQPKYVYSFDFNDVINIRPHIGYFDVLKCTPMMLKIGIQSPIGAAQLIYNWRSIKNRIFELTKTVKGTSNIFLHLAKEKKQEGYPDLAPYVPEMTAATVNVIPMWPIINKIKELKKNGHIIIGATNQDYVQYFIYRKKMAEQGVDLDTLFDAVVTAYTETQAEDISLDTKYHQIEPHVFMPTSPQGCKPNDIYFNVVKKIGTLYAPDATTFIHTDDKIENIEGARKAGFIGLHFALPKNKETRHCTDQELEETMQTWLNNIKQQSYLCDHRNKTFAFERLNKLAWKCQ